MNAVIVTFVRAYNYGAVLQCYALYNTLSELGLNTSVLDYYPDYFRNQYSLSYLKDMDVRLFPPYRPLKSWAKFAKVILTVRRRSNKFDAFIRKNISLTPRQYRTIEDLIADDCQAYDMYISGSDQVWTNGCVPFDPVFFLNFPSANGKRFSYAASFGFSAIPSGMEELYAERLCNWNMYSVREQSGSDILNRLLGVQPVVCCDPTLLLTRSDWSKISKVPQKREPYILVYSVNGDTYLYDCAEKLSKLKQINVVVLPCIMRHDQLMGYEEKKRGFHILPVASPDEWLGLFANATYVLTDSFHGTVFSILNKKHFLVQSSIKGHHNIRVEELLNYLNISSRELTEEIQNIDNALDWGTIDKQLHSLRQISMTYLKGLVQYADN